MTATDNLYRINDALTQLASELGVIFSDDLQEDTVLQDLTMAVAAGFGLDLED